MRSAHEDEYSEDSNEGSKQEKPLNLSAEDIAQCIKTLETLNADTNQIFEIPKDLSLIHISEPTRPERISYAVFCLKKNVPAFWLTVSNVRTVVYGFHFYPPPPPTL